MTVLLALVACGPRAWAERVIALDADSALVVTGDAELGIVVAGARWRSHLDLRGHDAVPSSLGWNGTAAVATADGTVVWNPADGAWSNACCGGPDARIAGGNGAFIGWEDGADGTVGLGAVRPAWRHPGGDAGRHVLGGVVALASPGRVALVRIADGSEVAALDGVLRCALADRVLVSTGEGLVALGSDGAVAPIGRFAAPGGCVERKGALVLFDGPAGGPADQLVEVASGRVMPVGPFFTGIAPGSVGVSGSGSPRYLAALRTEARANHWIALDLDEWRVVDGPATREGAERIGLARVADTTFAWCGEDVIALDGGLGTWHLATVRGWAGDPAAIADGVAWTRTYDRVGIATLAALSWGAGVRSRRSGAEPFPSCLGLTE